MRGLTAAAALALALAGCTAAANVPRPAAAASCPILAAHMGWHYPYWGEPENSLGALDAAVRYGHATWIETDPAVTRDGGFVIMHGGTSLYNVTGHTGAVANYTTAQLLAMRLREAPGLPYTAQHVPTLATYLARVKTDHVDVEIEGSYNWSAAQLATYIGVLKAAGGRWFTRVSSTSPAFLARVRAAYPGEGTDLLTAPYWPYGGSPAGSIQVDAAAGYLTAAQVTALHAAHVAVDVWTPDDAAGITAAVAEHADMVTTDNLTVFHHVTGC